MFSYEGILFPTAMLLCSGLLIDIAAVDMYNHLLCFIFQIFV
jgi:hypothetical protein